MASMAWGGGALQSPPGFFVSHGSEAVGLNLIPMQGKHRFSKSTGLHIPTASDSGQ